MGLHDGNVYISMWAMSTYYYIYLYASKEANIPFEDGYHIHYDNNIFIVERDNISEYIIRYEWECCVRVYTIYMKLYNIGTEVAPLDSTSMAFAVAAKAQKWNIDILWEY